LTPFCNTNVISVTYSYTLVSSKTHQEGGVLVNQLRRINKRVSIKTHQEGGRFDAKLRHLANW